MSKTEVVQILLSRNTEQQSADIKSLQLWSWAWIPSNSFFSCGYEGNIYHSHRRKPCGGWLVVFPRAVKHMSVAWL